MASYDQSFNQMQEEALARLREMQKRSRTAVNRPHPAPPPPPPEPPHRDPEPHRENHIHSNARPHQGGAPPQDILKNLLGDMKIDSEKALILLMLFVLYKNKADLKLLLALGYLLV